jgi:hypothetical protein
VSFGIFVKVGSRHEAPVEGRISHFIEPLLFKRDEAEDGRQIAQQSERMGDQINACTSEEFPCYEGRVLRQNLDDAQPTLPVWKRQSPASSQLNGPPKLPGAFGTPTAFQRRAVQGQGSAAARGEFG